MEREEFETAGGTYADNFEEDLIYGRQDYAKIELEDGTMQLFENAQFLGNYPNKDTTRFVIPYVQCVSMNYGIEFDRNSWEKLGNYISLFINKVQNDYYENEPDINQHMYILNVYYGTGTFINPTEENRNDPLYAQYLLQEDYRKTLHKVLTDTTQIIKEKIKEYDKIAENRAKVQNDIVVEHKRDIMDHIANLFSFDYKKRRPSFFTQRGMYRHLYAHKILETIFDKMYEYAPLLATKGGTAKRNLKNMLKQKMNPFWYNTAYKELKRHFLRRFEINFVLIPTPGTPLTEHTKFMVPMRPRNSAVLTVKGVYEHVQHILSFTINWLNQEGLFPQNMAEAKRAEILKTLINNFYIMIITLLTSTKDSTENRKLVDNWVRSIMLQFYTQQKFQEDQPRNVTGRYLTYKQQVTKLCYLLVSHHEFKISLENFSTYLSAYMKRYYQNLIYAIIRNISKGFTIDHVKQTPINLSMDHLVISEVEFNCHIWTTSFVRFLSYLHREMASLDTYNRSHFTEVPKLKLQLYRNYYVNSRENAYWHLYFIERLDPTRRGTIVAKPPATKPPERRNTNEALEDDIPRQRRPSTTLAQQQRTQRRPNMPPRPPVGPPPTNRFKVNFQAPHESVMILEAPKESQLLIYHEQLRREQEAEERNQPLTQIPVPVDGPQRPPRRLAAPPPMPPRPQGRGAPPTIRGRGRGAPAPRGGGRGGR